MVGFCSLKVFIYFRISYFLFHLKKKMKIHLKGVFRNSRARMAEENLFLDFILNQTESKKTSSSSSSSSTVTPTTTPSKPTTQDLSKNAETELFNLIKIKDDDVELAKLLREFPDLVNVRFCLK
jgi:hypothetical protein